VGFSDGTLIRATPLEIYRPLISALNANAFRILRMCLDKSIDTCSSAPDVVNNDAEDNRVILVDEVSVLTTGI
jgi:hypothetical protein